MVHFNTDVGFFFFSFPLVNKSKESDRIQLAYEVRPRFSSEMQVAGWRRKFKRNQTEWSSLCKAIPSPHGGGDE